MADERKDLAPDPYQAQYMAQGALYYDKIRAPRAFHLLLLGVLSIVAIAGVLAALTAGPAAMLSPVLSTVVLLSVWLLFSVLRVSVTRDEVYVQYGLFGPRVPVRDIERCAAVAYDWKKYGGWGIRYGRDGSVAYNMIGDHGRAVEIVYRKGEKSKKLLVASPDPERLAAAVNEARAMAAAGAAPARIEAAAAPALEAPKDEITRQAEAEAEALAAEAEAEAKRQA